MKIFFVLERKMNNMRYKEKTKREKNELGIPI